MIIEDIILSSTIPFMLMFVASTVAVVFVRLLKHREIMQYAKLGMYPPYQLVRSLKPNKTLKRGINTAAAGFGITFGLMFIGFGPWLIAGIIPLFVGMGQLVSGWMEMRAGVEDPPEDWIDEPQVIEKQPEDFEINL